MPNRLQRAPGRAENDVSDIFVGGAMRSGTSLTQRLLCTAPRVNDLVPEVKTLTAIVGQYARESAHAKASLEPFFSSPDEHREYYARCVDDLLSLARERKNPGGMLVLKNPELTINFPALRELHPAARFVLVVRDPRDCVASMKVVADRVHAAGAPLPMSEMADGIEGMAKLYLKYYAAVVNSGMIRESSRLHAVRYEDIVLDIETTLARLSLWTGLDLNPDRIVSPDSGDNGAFFGAALYGKKISDDSIGRYADRLDAEDIAIVERITAAFMQFFGYSHQAPG